MKKTVITTIIVTLSIAFILFFPFPQGAYKDGGTRVFRSLTYKLVIWNKHTVELDEKGKCTVSVYRHTSIYWFPDCNKSIGELWEIEMARHKN